MQKASRGEIYCQCIFAVLPPIPPLHRLVFVLPVSRVELGGVPSANLFTVEKNRCAYDKLFRRIPHIFVKPEARTLPHLSTGAERKCPGCINQGRGSNIKRRNQKDMTRAINPCSYIRLRERISVNSLFRIVFFRRYNHSTTHPQTGRKPAEGSLPETAH